MSRGYIVIAQNSGDTDYLRMAYGLALSLKATQTTVSNLCVCVDKGTKVPKKYLEVFDQVVEIPWQDDAKDSDWKIDNKWKYYYMSPYDETVILDTDMVFPTDVSHWWDTLCERDIWACTNVKTYRGENAVDHNNYYREYFVKNNMPNVYTAFFYFKKSETATEFFKFVEIIFQNWQRFFFKYMPNGKPEKLSADVVYALAIQLLGIEEETTVNDLTEIPTFTHMKSFIQDVPSGSFLDEKWTLSLPTYFNTIKTFKVGNFQQQYPFHYVDKNWLTDDIIKSLENEIT
jgi:hypothetical protein